MTYGSESECAAHYATAPRSSCNPRSSRPSRMLVMCMMPRCRSAETSCMKSPDNNGR